jgi:uncharacterized membrane protein
MGPQIVSVSVETSGAPPMTYDHSLPARAVAANPIIATLLSFPVACFTLTVVTDVAYMRTANLLWLHFSEWLLLAGLVGGCLALIAYALRFAFRRVRPSGLALLGGVVVLVLATINSLIHTADGWTAVVPWGLTVSIVTVLAMMVTAWIGRVRARHV